MAISLQETVSRFKSAWNVFRNGEKRMYRNYGESSASRQDQRKLSRGNRQSIVSSPLNKIAVDCAAIKIKHCRVDADGKYLETIDDEINKIFNISANIDQTGRAFIQDIVVSMLDEGVVAIVPVETDTDLINENSFGILNMRTGKIREWFPQSVRIELYNELTGRHEDIILPKSKVGIIENPLYLVMNEPNSTLQRLIRKMNLLDNIDEKNGSGKLDLLLKLPYSLRNERHKEQAKERKQAIEDQLVNSKFGIAYIDSTEQVTQLNRPVENSLPDQIKYLTEQFYSQIGLTQNVFNGTANEAEMLNYYTRTIEPIVSAICDELTRKFLTKTARAQKQSFCFFRDPFSLVPAEKIADIADRFTRNEILSSNEVRSIVGYKPVNDERADQLRNKNLNEQFGAPPPVSTNPNASEYQDEYDEYAYDEDYPPYQ